MDATALRAPNTERTTLLDAVDGVRVEFAQIKQELLAAYREIARLRSVLAQTTNTSAALPELDLPSLRRRIAFHCHPDRSGDDVLMRSINVLFDHLERAQQRRTRSK